jgi:hypothetical protein
VKHDLLSQLPYVDLCEHEGDNPATAESASDPETDPDPIAPLAPLNPDPLNPDPLNPDPLNPLSPLVPR